MTILPFRTPKFHFLNMNSNILNILVVIAFFIMGCSNSSLNDDKEYLLLCYNKEFGKRFSLSQGKALDLSKGLLAIGFGQSKRTGIRLYLYLDSSLDIYSPKACGDFCNHNRYHYFLDFNEKDQNLHTNQMVKQFNRILLQSKSLNHSEDGYVSSAEPVFIKKDILPGITLFAVHGFISPIFEPEYGPIEILIQKNNTGASIYQTNGPVDNKKVYRFDIPDKLTEHILKHLKEDSITPAQNPIEVYYP
ncbi:hypothetical protein [uncultured Desulfobacter sp.]|uniref:hypothetical protein n=1 Tax=uncultured Desulfobacter sp. TaxID=240139 RepID=UPI0029F567C0|nr:hypothetical protein [uncultured Desulfobacter sp.]